MKGLHGMGIQLAIKRLLDVVICFMILVIGFPIYLIIAILVRLSSPGPIFFVQDRVGLNGRIFQMYKFRTMMGAPDESIIVWSQSDEDRITKVGRFLRDYGLDELPQAVNILRGDMSIVGPRPPLPNQVENYSDHQKGIFKMRPGVFSLAAIKGRRSIPMEERIELHVQYVENWSLGLDAKILWKGLLVVLGREDVSETVVEEREV
ncbi:MAG: sugar transferase [Firmicutes bacterium]|nr:sugar transferase [Bacillota bacterium]